MFALRLDRRVRTKLITLASLSLLASGAVAVNRTPASAANVNGAVVDRTFGGVGAISGGG